MPDQLKYICTNCGNEVDSLYKQFGSVALKLTKCENCNLVADKYVEYDLVNVIIDLILLKTVAIRHFLFNSTYKKFWKLSLILLLLESYSNFILFHEESYRKPINETASLHFHADIYLENMIFYKVVLVDLFQTCSLVLSIYLLTRVYTTYNKKSDIPLFLIWKTVTLSNCSIFLTLPALIWDFNIYNIHYYFIFIYSTLSQLMNYKALTNSSKLWSILVIFLSNFLKQNILTETCPYQPF